VGFPGGTKKSTRKAHLGEHDHFFFLRSYFSRLATMGPTVKHAGLCPFEGRLECVSFIILSFIFPHLIIRRKYLKRVKDIIKKGKTLG
jgi:hypothetical protein